MGPILLSSFAADVTPPLGHALMGGGIKPASRIDDPLAARGIVLWGGCDPVVICVLDWCEVRNDAYDRWRDALADAAHTVRERVLLSCLHNHDAPIADLEAERILRLAGAKGRICGLEFHEKAVERVAAAARESMTSSRKITHVGTGQAKVERVASNRRFIDAAGRVSFSRTSSTRDPAASEADEGLIDPWLKTLTFWEGDRPAAAIHCYATHPMSFYGQGAVSSDFIGAARKRRQAETGGCFQIYMSGCSGDVTAGKYNDGSPENRPILAGRIRDAMAAAERETKRAELREIGWRSVPLTLEPRGGPGFTDDDLRAKLSSETSFENCLAALGLSWRKRCAAGQPIDVPALDFGAAQLILLPGESYVEFQLAAQSERPGGFVMAAGYGESGTGYIPPDRAIDEGDTNLRDWCWVARGSEARMLAAIRAALAKV